jgi:hypothetical protein
LTGAVCERHRRWMKDSWWDTHAYQRSNGN